MARIEHVRFNLTELIAAARKAMQVEVNPTVQQALTFYWNWAAARGWKLLAVTNQMDTNMGKLTSTGENWELRHEEFWNVVWSAEDSTGWCDLVQEMAEVTP
jgi:hypothetical protein